MENISVVKRNGKLEKLDLSKITKVITWAAKGLTNVSVSQVELKSHIQFTNLIKTEDIHEVLIKTAADLISEENPDYQYLAANLSMEHIRKKAYGRFEPPTLYDHVNKMVDLGKYDAHILEDYSPLELAELNDYLDHSRDFNFSYAAVKQLEGKYLCQDRHINKIYETPQFLYMLVSMCLFSKYSEDVRMEYVKKFYDAASLFKISLPTPIMAGVRTPVRQFSSCVLIESDDTLDSINASASAIVNYVAKKAGIGINGGRIRAEGSKVGDGTTVHTGVIPFWKYFQTALKSCSQG